MSYKLKLDMFEGPLDLLLYLIKKNDINVYDIPIAKVTDQYMEYIEMMKLLDLEFVGDFLVMAATLMQIKSRMLLPPDPSQEEEEADPRDELVRKLQEYKIFKEIADHLKTKEAERQKLFPRKMDEELLKELEEDSKEVYFEASLFDLINAFTKALNRFRESPVYEVTQEEYTVEQKIHDILHALLRQPRALLTEFFVHASSKMEVIVTFMAILELIRLREIKVMQKRLFADIEVFRNSEKELLSGPADQPVPSSDTESGPDSEPAT
ncbi:MAG TPA: segregation/condensation protein A [Candidatus Omnitrophota bacterium]|jgi:segregation and condensation protein A|nr:segregation/condensation protein A [Candidatus Omnitrophota bacterium]HPN56067.1 segregation/condensation protein A [Candidatus Omnitrophota bacterium]